MKNLLDLSRQRKEAERLTTNNKPAPVPPKQMLRQSEPESQEIQEEDQDFEPSEQQIFEYAQFLGIDPYREKNLLHIAREGLITPVPPPWDAIQKGNQVIYINRQTGEKTLEHPLDQLFRQLVIEERKKLKPYSNISSQGVMVAPLKPQFQQQQVMDPLLQLELERKKKKSESDALLKFSEKKKELQQKYKKQEEQVRQQYQEKQARVRSQYLKQEEEIRNYNKSKASQKQKENQTRINRELDEFREKIKKELEVTFQKRITIQKESLTLIYASKKQDMKRVLEQNYKNKKKESQEDYNSRVKQIQIKQDTIKKQIRDLQTRLNQEIQNQKEKIIEKGLDDHKYKIDEHRAMEEKRYQEEIRRLEQEHNQKLSKLMNNNSQKSQYDNIFSLESFVKELEKNEENKMKGIKYQMDSYRALKKSEMENELMDYESELQKQAERKLLQIKKASQDRVEAEIMRLEKQMKFKSGQIQKTANNDYLKSLEEYERIYNKEEGVLVGHHKNIKMIKHSEASQDELTLKRLTNQYEEAQKQSLYLRKQLQRTKLQYQTTRQQVESEEIQKGPITKLLTEEQRKMYERIMNISNRIINERRELQLKELM